MTIKVGPVSSTYRGKVVFERLDPAARTAEIVATGQDVRGKGGADLKLTSSLKALPGGKTEVTAVSLVNVDRDARPDGPGDDPGRQRRDVPDLLRADARGSWRRRALRPWRTRSTDGVGAPGAGAGSGAGCGDPGAPRRSLG